MLNLFKKLFKKDDTPEYDYTGCEALIIEITLESLTELELGTEDEREYIFDMEKRLTKLMPEGTIFDGHGFGEGECELFFYGKSADEMFGAARTTLKKCRFQHIEITLQYGMPDDPATTDITFTL